MRIVPAAVVASVLGSLLLPATSSMPAAASTASHRRAHGLSATLADAFRADLSSVDVRYDYWPRRSRVRGSAVLRFVMRPGEHRALFHFDPTRRAESVTLRLA